MSIRRLEAYRFPHIYRLWVPITVVLETTTLLARERLFHLSIANIITNASLIVHPMILTSNPVLFNV
jgi:hypothetical protein